MRNVADNLQLERAQVQQQLTQPERIERPKHKASARARQLWDRLSDWYGVRFADQYGDEPSRDWCTVVDNSSNDELVRVLTLVRRRHVTFPPTLPEFAALVKEVREARSIGRREQTVQEALTEFVSARYQLTQQQSLSSAWTFLYRTTPDGAVICTGVVVAQCDAAAGVRVMVDDMNAATADL